MLGEGGVRWWVLRREVGVGWGCWVGGGGGLGVGGLVGWGVGVD